MNSSNFRFTLDLHSSQSQVSLPVMLGDTARKFYISLMDGGTPFRIEDGCVAMLTITRPTQNFIQHFCVIEGNTTIVYDFRDDPNTAAAEGLHNCEISLYDAEGALISSPRFSMVVSHRVMSRDIELDDQDRTILNDMIVSEAARTTAEATRVSNEATRLAAEDERVIAESIRAINETEREENELARLRAEEVRVAADDRRLAAESVIVAAENARTNNENDRVFNESNRMTEETKRLNAEAVREANEAVRISNENTRVSVEYVRVQNENTRESEESKRAVAEVKRAMEWENLKEEVSDTAIDMSVVDEKVSAHNDNTGAHADLRLALQGLADRVNSVLDSDDVDLDQWKEVVAYIKNNKSLIDGITTSKVNVADIINNLVTSATNKPLSAAQGMALRLMIEGLTAADVGALPSDTPIPYKLADMAGDTTHRTVTDAEKAAWNAKSDFSGKYGDLSEKPNFGEAAAKNVDTSMGDGSDSTNLPTSKAVADFVEGKGYVTKDTTYTFGSGDGNGQIKVTPAGGSAQNVDVKGLGSAAYTASTAYDAAGSANAVQNKLDSHVGNSSNPHGVTAAQVGALPKSGGTLTGAITLPNNTALKSKDNAGTEKEVLRANANNQIILGAANLWELIVLYHGIVPATSALDTLEIGTAGRRWKNLYLSGVLSDGTNSVSIANIAKKSDIPAASTPVTYALSKSGGVITLTGSNGTTSSVTDSDTDTVYTHPGTHPASMITGLATVATSGKFSDLSGKPATETWTFTLEDGTTVTKAVYVG